MEEEIDGNVILANWHGAPRICHRCHSCDLDDTKGQTLSDMFGDVHRSVNNPGQVSVRPMDVPINVTRFL